MRKTVSLFLLLAALLFLPACGTKQADLSAYGDVPIAVSGLKEEEFTVTAKELSQLDCVSRTATGKTAKAGTASATGPLLNTFLAQYGFQASDFTKIRFICSDGYKVTLKGNELTEYEIILAVSAGGEPLAEKQRPLRILIPKAESGKWAYGIIRMEFEREPAQ